MKKQILIGLLLIAGCASPGGLFGETVGEKFRKALANVDAVCRERKIGPYLDQNDPEYRRKSSLMNCEVLKIKPFDLNAVLATPEGQFAYSIQLPPPLDKPRVKRADYRSAEEYFKALCEREQGDFVFATVNNVKGMVALRTVPDGYRQPLGSYSEESLGSQAGGARPEHLLLQRLGLEFVERQVHADDRNRNERGAWRSYFFDAGKLPTFPDFGLRYEIIAAPRADIAVVWRGATHWSSRDEGIVGSELLVVERASRRVLALRRTFTMDEADLKITDRVSYSSRACPGTYVTEGYELISRAVNPTQK